jgi:hypothetical protein
MTFRRSVIVHPTSIVAGAVLGLAVASPALAANFALPFDLNALGWRDLLLYGSIALLVVALTVKVIRDKRDAEATPQAPDLRWWKNQDQHI